MRIGSAWLELVVLVIASAGCSIPPRYEPAPEVQIKPVAAAVPPKKPVVESVVDPSGCLRGGRFEQVCIPALPEGIARCEDCDLACIRRAFERLRERPILAGLACDVPPVSSGDGCCFSAKVTGDECVFGPGPL